MWLQGSFVQHFPSSSFPFPLAPSPSQQNIVRQKIIRLSTAKKKILAKHNSHTLVTTYYYYLLFRIQLQIQNGNVQ